MYKLPKLSDFQRNLDNITHNGKEEARLESQRIQSESVAKSVGSGGSGVAMIAKFLTTNLGGTGQLVSSVAKRLDQLHVQVTEKAMRLIYEHMKSAAISETELFQTAAERLKNYAEEILAELPKTSLRETGQQIKNEYSRIFQQRLESALRDIEIGFISGVSVATAENAPKRLKSEKFNILDSPKLKDEDVTKANGTLGIGCIYLDIDGFKALNTEFSERNIDKDILPEFQKLLAAAVENNGFAYAEGGDEIVILLPNSNLKNTLNFTDALREKLASRKFSTAGKEIELKVSVGVAHIEEKGDRSTLVNNANLAMRKAKKLGKDRVHIYSKDDSQEM